MGRERTRVNVSVNVSSGMSPARRLSAAEHPASGELQDGFRTAPGARDGREARTGVRDWLGSRLEGLQRT